MHANFEFSAGNKPQETNLVKEWLEEEAVPDAYNFVNNQELFFSLATKFAARRGETFHTKSNCPLSGSNQAHQHQTPVSDMEYSLFCAKRGKATSDLCGKVSFINEPVDFHTRINDWMEIEENRSRSPSNASSVASCLSFASDHANAMIESESEYSDSDATPTRHQANHSPQVFRRIYFGQKYKVAHKHEREISECKLTNAPPKQSKRFDACPVFFTKKLDLEEKGCTPATSELQVPDTFGNGLAPPATARPRIDWSHWAKKTHTMHDQLIHANRDPALKPTERTCGIHDWIDYSFQGEPLGSGSSGIVVKERLASACRVHDTLFARKKHNACLTRGSRGKLPCVEFAQLLAGIRYVAVKTVFSNICSSNSGCVEREIVNQADSFGESFPNKTPLVAVSVTDCAYVRRIISISQHRSVSGHLSKLLKEYQKSFSSQLTDVVPSLLKQRHGLQKTETRTSKWVATCLVSPCYTSTLRCLVALDNRPLSKYTPISKDCANPLRRFKRIVSSLKNGIQVLHVRKDPIAHRDLKPSNIFLANSDDHVVIGDFGSSVSCSSPELQKNIFRANFEEKRPHHVNSAFTGDAWAHKAPSFKQTFEGRRMTECVTTPHYASPEIVSYRYAMVKTRKGANNISYFEAKGNHAAAYGLQTDVWAFGIIFVELLIGCMLLGPPSNKQDSRVLMLTLYYFFKEFLPHHVEALESILLSIDEFPLDWARPQFVEKIRANMKAKHMRLVNVCTAWQKFDHSGDGSSLYSKIISSISVLLHPNQFERVTIDQLDNEWWFDAPHSAKREINPE